MLDFMASEAETGWLAVALYCSIIVVNDMVLAHATIIRKGFTANQPTIKTMRQDSVLPKIAAVFAWAIFFALNQS